MTELSYFVPSFSVDSSNTSRNTTVSIRGIGSSGTNPGIEPSVGVFIDGVYQASGAQVLGDLVDIQTLEVLRGPQGTLYGRNTPVGAVNVTTRRPDATPDAMVRLTAGDYDYLAAKGYVSGPLGERAAARVSFWADDREGYEDNLFTGEDANDRSEYGARGRLVISPSDSLDIDLGLHGSFREQRCCIAEQLDPTGPLGIATDGFLAAQEALGFPFRNFDDDDRTVDADDEGDDETTTWGASLRADWTLPSGRVLTSITAYEDWDNDALISADALPQNVFVSQQQQINEVWSQELRIASSGQGSIDYLAGIFLYAQDTSFDQVNVVGPGANRQVPPPLCGGVAPCTLQAGDSGGTRFEQETRSAAAFGSLTWNLSTMWDVTGGLRFSHDEKDVFIDHYNDPSASPLFNVFQRPSRPGDLDRSDDNVTWSLNTRFRPRDDMMLFATIATGFKSGGFNSRRLPQGAQVEFEEEESITYELGIKASWLDQRLNTNATVFWTELHDFQESVQNPDPNIPGFVVGNAGDRRVRGMELDATARPVPQLTLNASVAYLDAEFTDYSAGQCAPGQTPDGSLPGTCDFDGKTPATSPDWKGSLAAEWIQTITGTELEWLARADYAFVDDQLYASTLAPSSEQKAYELLNLRAAIRAQSGRWELAAWGKNVTDETYNVVIATQPVAGFISGGGFAGAQGFVSWYGAPRTWGVDFTYRM
jgi:iron complex outermembrane receptor protein